MQINVSGYCIKFSVVSFLRVLEVRLINLGSSVQLWTAAEWPMAFV